MVKTDEGLNCPNCNFLLGPFAKQCRNCGMNLKESHKVTQLVKSKVVRIEETKQIEQFVLDNITFKTEVDPFTEETLFENYSILSKQLQVFPKVIVYPRGSTLSTHFAGFYKGDGFIEVVDDYLLISCLAHEMRHCYQQQYLPKMYYSAKITSYKEYINSELERDARKFSMDYCKSRGYLEELQYLEEQEYEYDLILQGINLPEKDRLIDEYFRYNPIYPQTYYETNTEYYKHSEPEKVNNNHSSSPNKSYKIEGHTILGVILLILCFVGLYLLIVEHGGL